LLPHHPAALLEDAVVKSCKALAGHKVSIVSENAGNDRAAWFDAHSLGRVLRHLLENAGAHTPPGTDVTLSYSRTDNRLVFTLADNGPGIDSADLPMIFEKFYRGKRTSSARKGSGMGLAIARAILIAHGGGIDATSEPGKGATFRFWVPLIENDPDELTLGPLD
jgi:two-component system, OmpR family, sensor histidine kinase ResE